LQQSSTSLPRWRVCPSGTTMPSRIYGVFSLVELPLSMATMAAGSSSCEHMSYCAGKEGEVECIAAALGSEAKYTVGSGFVELAVMLPIDSTSPVRKALSSSSVMKAWDGTEDVPWPSMTFGMTLMIFSTCCRVSPIV